METILGILAIAFIIVACNSTKWRSNSRTTPPGYTTDFKQASIDITLRGKDYYHKKHLAGGYDVPDKK